MLIHQGTTFCANVSLEIANPLQLQPLALEFPRLRMVIAHMGHPWIDETLVLIRKNRNMYADISALYYRPWQFYNALVCGDGVWRPRPAAVWFRLSVHNAGVHHRGAAASERAWWKARTCRAFRKRRSRR